MSNLIVVDNPNRWPLHVPGVPVVAAKTYLADPQYSESRNLKIFNLCKSYRYQSTGYYVSLLAMARGQKPLPSITTIQDMKSMSIARIVAEDLDSVIQRSLSKIKSPAFTLSIYFGRNVAKRYDELCEKLMRLFQVPLMRAEFEHEDEHWQLASVHPISASSIPETHQPFVIEAAAGYFAQKRIPAHRPVTTQYDLAILHDPNENHPPSNERALTRFAASAKRLRLGCELIRREDLARIAEFDALFIRETTAVNHHTYRFARRATAEGLVVVDDPESITKCSNKVYLAELLTRQSIAIPRTMIVHKENCERVVETIGLPCIIKQPDSSFSQGVSRADDPGQLAQILEQLLEKSDLVIAQEFVPTGFDWRIGVLDREPLFAAKYHMVKEHWQIAKRDADGTRYGNVEAVAIEDVPHGVLNTALKAARLIGDGLYGVDVKQIGDRACVIEVNDNPNIDAGYEDRIMRDELYDRIMQFFLQRIRRRKFANGKP